MLQVQSPFQQFFDTGGDPLDDGYVYIGASGQNPETNPIAIYWDDAGTIPAAQPIRTSSGYLVRNGTPSRLFVAAEDFSMTVKTKRLEVVFNVPDATTIGNLQIQLASGTGAGMVGFLQIGTGSQQRTVQNKLEDSVSVFDFMTAAQIATVKAGTSTNDTAAIQAAVNTGKSVFLPKGVYHLTGPITLSSVGQRFYGETLQDTYLVGGSHDLVRVAASHCEVDHVHFRPSAYSDTSPPAFAPIRIYAALAHIHNNRFLSAATGHGCAIFTDDVNPADGSIVAGAYTHTIENNYIGASSYDFKYSVFCLNVNNGMQATKFQNNQILGDSCFYVYYGGGNYYVGNLLQSATGSYTTGAGNGIDLQSAVIGETITGNYIERFQHGIITRRLTTDYLVAHATMNHFDNNTSNLTAVGSAKYKFFDETTLIDWTNTWNWSYASQDDLLLRNREGIAMLNFNRASYAVEARVLGHTLQQSLSYTADGQTQTPTSSWAQVTGAGAARIGCVLGAGTRSGQHLYLFGMTWAVTLSASSTVQFNASAASATFGNASGNVSMMHLIWDAASGKWFEVSRSVV